MVFMATLIVGYIYVWKKGIFDWGLQARAEAREEAKADGKTSARTETGSLKVDAQTKRIGSKLWV